MTDDPHIRKPLSPYYAKLAAWEKDRCVARRNRHADERGRRAVPADRTVTNLGHTKPYAR